MLNNKERCKNCRKGIFKIYKEDENTLTITCSNCDRLFTKLDYEEYKKSREPLNA